MDFNQKHGRVFENVVNNCTRFNKPIPKEYLDPPELEIHMVIFYQAFLDLDTDRIHGEFAPNPIPFSSIIRYAQFYQFDEEMTHDLIYYVRGLDNFHLEKLAKEYKARAKTKK